MPEKKTPTSKTPTPKAAAKKAVAKKAATLDDVLNELRAIREQLEWIETNTTDLAAIKGDVEDISEALKGRKR